MREPDTNRDWDELRPRHAGPQNLAAAEQPQDLAATVQPSDRDFVADLSAALDALHQKIVETAPIPLPDGAPISAETLEPARLRWGAAARDAIASDRAAAACAAIGFFTGAIAWHFVGFWSFVTAIAFNGDVRDHQAPAHAGGAAVPHRGGIVTGSIARPEEGSASGCIALAIDRFNGGIQPGPCDEATGDPVRAGAAARKGDRSLTSFSERIERDIDRASTPNTSDGDAAITPSTPQIDDADFDLQLRPGP
ncbi:MAG: hypothetical protein ACT4OU_05480 [Hyphomicrobium sp.]